MYFTTELTFADDSCISQGASTFEEAFTTLNRNIEENKHKKYTRAQIFKCFAEHRSLIVNLRIVL